MNYYQELMDGAGGDSADDPAMREALHHQLRLDAALTAHFGGAHAEAHLRRSVIAALSSQDDAFMQQRVMGNLRSRRYWRTAALLATAAGIVIMTAWLFLVPAPHPDSPMAERTIPAAPSRPAITETVVHAKQKTETQPVPITQTPPLIPAPASVPKPPPQVATQSPPVPSTITQIVPPMVVAKPDAGLKPTLGTPPPPALTPTSAPKTKRDPAHWPFAPASPWNTPIGSEAKLEVIQPAEFASLPIGFQPRTIFIATARQPVLRFKRSRGPAIKVPFASEWADTPSLRSAPVTIIEPNQQWAIEYQGLTLSNGDWNVAEITRYSLLDNGIDREGRGMGELGLPALAGVIRTGEWESGIPHVIGIVVPISMLDAKAGGRRAYVWPAQPSHDPDTTGFAKRGNLHLGSLLTLPADAHPLKLGLTEGTTEYRLALALWNHGACIMGGSKEGRMGISLLTETLGRGSMDREALKRVFALLQVVTSNSPARPGGGGAPRCDLAPAFDAKP